MRIVWLNEDLTEAVVRRRTFPIFGTYVEATVRRESKYDWRYVPSNDPVPNRAPLGAVREIGDILEDARDDELKKREVEPRQHERNWRQVFQPQTRLPPARLVQK